MWKMGWFGVVKGHPRPLKIALFDRTHTSSYQLSVCPYLAPFLRYSEMLSKITDLNLPQLYLGPPFGVTRCNFAEIFGISKLCAIVFVSYDVVAANSIFAKVGRLASEEVIVHQLLKQKCMSVFLYALVCNLDNKSINSMD